MHREATMPPRLYAGFRAVQYRGTVQRQNIPAHQQSFFGDAGVANRGAVCSIH